MTLANKKKLKYLKFSSIGPLLSLNLDIVIKILGRKEEIKRRKEEGRKRE